MKIKVNRNQIILLIAVLGIGVLIGYFISTSAHQEISTSEEHKHAEASEVWTCSMHPQIRKSEPGQCPICGMDLIPVDEGDEGASLDPMAISMSPTAMQLADVTTSIVGETTPVKTVRLNGKIQEDERLVFSQSTHIPGRIEKLLVNFTGEFVRKGQTLAEIYSPELVTAQEELFEAQKIKDTQPALFKSAKAKLKNWKLTEKHIDQILSSGEIREAFPIHADVSGYVTGKNVNLGDYVKKGTSIYEVANLSRVWALFDVYESDMPWVNKGDQVTFTIQSLPGDKFSGKISYLDPVIDPKTRVAKARVVVANSGYKLKPEMFASGVVKATLQHKGNALVVPKSAVMWTGKRSVVYVKNTTDQGISFKMRNVTLGPALGENYIIEEGLEKGEEIATSGTFSIDAAAQLAGKPSMMSPEGGAAMTGHDHGNMNGSSASSSASTASSTSHSENISVNDKAKDALKPVIKEYLTLKDALVNDAPDKALAAAQSLQKELDKVEMSLFKGDAHNMWMEQSGALKNALGQMTLSTEISDIRNHFIKVSSQMVVLAKTFKPTEETIYVQHCPMANNNQGADWLSHEKEIKNPYYGASMLTCGEVTSEIK